MKKVLSILVLLLLFGCDQRKSIENLTTPYELSNGKATASYDETIAWWIALEEASSNVKLMKVGMTDSGEPLHLAMINNTGNFNLEHLQNRNVPLLLINNGIHPGEPDGVDASMLLIRDLLLSEPQNKLLDRLIIAVIPMYNVGGALNRNCCSRANQSGPEAYGFRGNARNLDLNRDFIKADSKNAQSFLELVTALDPDIYLETHVSNGADYPYTLTYLMSHQGKQTPPLGQFVHEAIERPLVDSMLSKGDAIIPYVNVFGSPPDSGYTMFYDSPRYSTGYFALKQSISLLTETHMLKPFSERVRSTHTFMQTLVRRIASLGDTILQKRQDAKAFLQQQSRFTLSHKTNKKDPDKLRFRGYKAFYDSSEVTGTMQLFYNRSVTWEADIPYYNKLLPLSTVKAPSHYLVPAAWYDVVDRLKLQGVEMEPLKKDTQMSLSRYRIVSFETVQNPYEGHYLHSATRVEKEKTTVNLRKDAYYLISTEQNAKRILIETLEPEATDSYFNWNFFDEVLQQKEWFSSYVFEPEAAEMLKDASHREAYDAFIRQHPEYKDNAFAKLYFLYKRTPHFEADRFMVYPVFRIDEAD